MADTIQLEVVTPERVVASEAAEYIEMPASTGYIGVLPGHAPLLTELAPGEISYRIGAQIKRLAVGWGLAEVLPNRVTILARVAERAEEIDVVRAQAAKQRAEEALRTATPGTDMQETQIALQRATARLEVAAKK
jgi:F-type H+-transporting ATPase subunit epsilon